MLSVILISLSIFSIVFISPTYILAKCPFETYTVRGQVVDVNRNPLNCASVSVFFDDDKSGDNGESFDEGKFEIKYYYSTYRYTSFWGDRCGKKPSSVTLVIQSPGYAPNRITFQLDDLVKEIGDNIIEIPVIILIPAWKNNSQ